MTKQWRLNSRAFIDKWLNQFRFSSILIPFNRGTTRFHFIEVKDSHRAGRLSTLA